MVVNCMSEYTGTCDSLLHSKWNGQGAPDASGEAQTCPQSNPEQAPEIESDSSRRLQWNGATGKPNMPTEGTE